MCVVLLIVVVCVVLELYEFVVCKVVWIVGCVVECVCVGIDVDG